MTLLQDHLGRACSELGLEIHAPHQVGIEGSVAVVAQAWIPCLGARKGMLVFGDVGELAGLEQSLIDEGFGYSVMGEPTRDERFELDSYVALFIDWGWTGIEEKRPNWMSSPTI